MKHDEAVWDHQKVRVNYDDDGDLAAVQIWHTISDGYIEVRDKERQFVLSTDPPVDPEAPLWLLKLLSQHADMTDRSSDDGCLCDEGRESAGRYDEHLGKILWDEIVERYRILATAHERRVLAQVGRERSRQDEKWGQLDHPDGTSSDQRLLPRTDVNLDLRTGEELSRIFRRRCNDKFAEGKGTFFDILLEEVFEAGSETNPVELRKELIQVAAVAVAWVEAIDRREWEK